MSNKSPRSILLSFIPLILCSLGSMAPAVAQDLVPAPSSLTPGAAQLTLTTTNRVVYSDAALQRLAEIHTDDIRRTHGVTLAAPAQGAGPASGDIFLTLAGDLSGEDYRLTVNASNVTLEAADYDGLAFAMMTNLQALSRSGADLEIPQMTIADSPHRPYRAHQATIKINGGVSASNYYGIDLLKKHIELCRFYKVRYFQIHNTESQWMFAALNSSNTLSQATLESLNLYSKAQWDDLIEFAQERGVHLTAHHETTESFEGMKIALIDFGNTGINWINELYTDAGVALTDGRDGVIAPAGNGVDAGDPDFAKTIELLTRRSYQQFAAGFANGKVPYYHMGPVQGEGGTSPAEMAKVLSYLRLEDPDVKLLFWGGPNPNDPIIQAHKADLVVDLYSPGQFHALMQAHIDAGLTTINAAWRPNYITPGVTNSRRYIFDNSNLFRMGSDGILGPVQYSLASESASVIGGLLPEWDFSNPNQGQLEAAIPRIPVWMERLWNYTPFANYTASDFDAALSRFDAAAAVADRFLAAEAPPSVPANLSATNGVYPDQVCLIWTPSDNFPTGYDVYRSTGTNPAAATLIESGVTIPNHCDDTVTPGTTYNYWVKAANQYGDSAFSSMATGVTGSGVTLPAVYEPFAYTLGQPIDGQSGGTGMTGAAWSYGGTVGPYTIVNGLTYPSLITTGGALSIHPNTDGQGSAYVVSRPVDGALDIPATQLWCSFLLRTEDGQSGDAYFSLNDRAGVARGFTPFDSVPGTLGLRMGGTGSGSFPMDYESGSSLPGKTYFLVMRLDFTSGNDRAALWVNPGPNEPSPGDAVGLIDDVLSIGRGDFNGFWFRPQGFGQGEFIIDELRLGPDYQSVAPGIATTPDPGEIDVSPATLTFANQDLEVASSPQTVTIDNLHGTNELIVSNVVLSGSHPDDFVLTGATGAVILPSGNLNVDVAFKPTAIGARNAELLITSNDADEGSTAIPLTGTGLATLPSAPANPTPADGATEVAKNTNLDWDDTTGAGSYDVFLWKSGDAMPGTPTANVATSEYSPGILDLNTDYLWQIASRNAAGTTSGPTWTFTSQMAPTPSIGWNYRGLGGVDLNPADIAGAPGFEQDNWNNHAGAGQGPGSVPFALHDVLGVATTAQVTSWALSLNNSWQHNDTSSPDHILMNDFNDREPALTFAGIPYTGYDVVVYYGNNEGPSTSTLTVGAQSRTITTGNTGQSSFGSVGYLEGTDANTTSPTNFSVFTGLSGANLTVSLSGSNNNGLSAIQIIDDGSGTVTPPAAPANPSPSDGATEVPNGTSLNWNDASGATSYDVFVWTNGETMPASPTANVGTSDYSPSLFDSDTSYLWHIVSRNTAGTAPGPTWSFTTAAVAAASGSIGWNYFRSTSLGPTDLAGAPGFEQDHWNNHQGAGQGPGSVPFPLDDNTGTGTTAEVTAWTLSTNNSWQHGQTSNPDQILMNDFNDREPSVTFSSIPYGTYDLVVYYGNNEGPSTSTLAVTGAIDDAQSRSITTGNTSQASYGLNGYLEETGSLTGPTNFTVFTGLDDAQTTVALTGSNNNGLSAIQIVDATPVLAGFALWQATTPGAGSGFDSNNDGDAWTDLVEYALGGDPATGLAPPGLPVVDGSGGTIDLTFSRPVGISDVLYGLEGSINATNWFTITDISPSSVTNGGTETLAYTGLTLTADVPGIATSPVALFRLRFTLL